MGQSCSHTLQKVSQSTENQKNASTTLNKAKNKSSFKDLPKARHDSSMVQVYFGFSAFFEESKDRKIYEWCFLKLLCKGSMSEIYLAQNTETQEICVAKIYNSDQLLKQTLGQEELPYEAVKREILIMSTHTHRYILSIIEVIEDDFTNSLILMLPYAANGTLQTILDSKQYTIQTLCCCFFQVAIGLQYLHSQNVVHRDIKPENIFSFSNDYYVLSDFSVSTQLDQPDMLLNDTQGSPAFLSPEECNYDNFSPKEADVWAYGITMYLSFFGKLPFNLDEINNDTIAGNVLAVTECITNNELIIPEDTDIDKTAIDLLKRILDKDPKKRPTFDEIVANPWFDEIREFEKLNEEEEDFEGLPLMN